MTLSLPVLEAMGAEVVKQTPRRFCAIYTANGMSLPNPKHGIREWSWFPTARGTGNSYSASRRSRCLPFRKQLSFMGGLHHPNGAKADPHVCSDMWLTGAPLHNPKPGTYNTVGLDQVIALHTKQYCRQPSLVLSIDAGSVSFRGPARFPTALKASRSRPRTIPGASSIACSAAIGPRSIRGADQLKRRIKLVDAVLESHSRSARTAWQVRPASGWIST